MAFFSSDNAATSTSAPAWYQQHAKDNLDNAADIVANNPWQAYGGQRVAELSPDQTAGINVARSSAGSWAPGMATAANMNTAATAGYGGPQAQGGNIQAQQWAGDPSGQYTNPYNQAVTKQTVDEMNRQHQINKQGIGDNAQASKAFGGDRHAIVEAEANRNHGQNVTNYINTSNQAGYESARDQFNTDQAMRMQGDMFNVSSGQTATGMNMGQLNADKNRQMTGATNMANMATAESQLGRQDANMLYGAGALEADNKQKQLDIDYQNYYDAWRDPYNANAFMTGAIQGTPTPTTTTTSGGGPTMASQVAGLGTAAVGALGLGNSVFNWF